jgi:transposase, IS5 family
MLWICAICWVISWVAWAVWLAKARTPYEFGCKVSIVTPVTKPKGGQFVLHAKALHGNPFDGHTLGPVIADLTKLTGIEPKRIHVDKGYKGHSHPEKFRV